MNIIGRNDRRFTVRCRKRYRCALSPRSMTHEIVNHETAQKRDELVRRRWPEPTGGILAIFDKTRRLSKPLPSPIVHRPALVGIEPYETMTSIPAILWEASPPNLLISAFLMSRGG